VNRSLPDAELDNFVDALATRIASFDKWAIANTKRLVNAASLPPTSRSQPGGCLPYVDHATRCAGKNKGVVETGFSPARRCRKSTGILPGATWAVSVVSAT